jgi:hypothetical protein
VTIADDKEISPQQRDAIRSYEQALAETSPLQEKILEYSDRLGKLRNLHSNIERLSSILASSIAATERNIEAQRPQIENRGTQVRRLEQVEHELEQQEEALGKVDTEVEDYKERSDFVQQTLSTIREEIKDRITEVRSRATEELEEVKALYKAASEAFEQARVEFQEARDLFLAKKESLEQAHAEARGRLDAFQATRELISAQLQTREQEVAKELLAKQKTLDKDASKIAEILAMKQGMNAGKRFRIAELKAERRRFREQLVEIESTMSRLESQAAIEAQDLERDVKEVLKASRTDELASALLLGVNLSRNLPDEATCPPEEPPDFQALAAPEESPIEPDQTPEPSDEPLDEEEPPIQTPRKPEEGAEALADPHPEPMEEGGHPSPPPLELTEDEEVGSPKADILDLIEEMEVIEEGSNEGEPQFVDAPAERADEATRKFLEARLLRPRGSFRGPLPVPARG